MVYAGSIPTLVTLFGEEHAAGTRRPHARLVGRWNKLSPKKRLLIREAIQMENPVMLGADPELLGFWSDLLKQGVDLVKGGIKSYQNKQAAKNAPPPPPPPPPKASITSGPVLYIGIAAAAVVAVVLLTKHKR